MAHGDAQEGKWRGNWQMEWVARTLHTTSEHGVSSITTADAHTAASSWLNWHPRRFKWTCPFRRKTKHGFCACPITFQLAPKNKITFLASIITVTFQHGSYCYNEVTTLLNSIVCTHSTGTEVHSETHFPQDTDTHLIVKVTLLARQLWMSIAGIWRVKMSTHSHQAASVRIQQCEVGFIIYSTECLHSRL